MTDLNADTALMQAHFYAIEQQIRPWYVDNTDLLNYFNEYPRHLFFKPAKHAYIDEHLPLYNAGKYNLARYCLSPKVEARLIQIILSEYELLCNQPEDYLNHKPEVGTKLAVIGADSGYLAFILSHWFKTSIIEQEFSLLEQIQQTLKYIDSNKKIEAKTNINMLQQQFLQPFTSDSFDWAICTFSSPYLINLYKECLHEGGNLFAFVGDKPLLKLNHYKRVGDALILQKTLFETWVEALPDLPKLKQFVF